jgi:predicted acyl esterase
MGTEYAAPDGFYQAPLTVTDKVEILSWSTDKFEEPTELIGTGAAHLFAEIDQPDTNFILRLWDYAPNGKRQLITSGYLKASHRELDERTTEGNPYHPHTRAVPVEPGQIEEYVLRLYPFANTFNPGHRLDVELSNDEPSPTSTTPCSPRTPSTCRWAGPSPTRSTATPPTPPGSSSRSPPAQWKGRRAKQQPTRQDATMAASEFRWPPLLCR